MASVNDSSTTDDPATLIARLQHLAPRLSNEEDHGARRECLRISKALTAELEHPENVALDMAHSPMIALCARIAVDLGLFEHIDQHGPVTSEALAKVSGAEESLIVRILRLLSAVHFVKEAALRTWEATRITKAMARREIGAGHRILRVSTLYSHLVVPAMQSAPTFFLQNGYSSPVDPKKGLVQFAFSTEKSTFEYIASSPSLLKDFNLFMGNTMGARRFWVDWYPVQSRILDGAAPDKALIVDIGAGRGHDLVAFMGRFLDAVGPGQLVLEDLPPVIEDGGLELDMNGPGANGAIRKVAYDFFMEQPVKGARVYFLHHILHDWSDEYCLKILQNVVSAMTPRYSKLLIHEMIVLEQGAPQFQAQLDMAMMAFSGGMERTRRQWRALLEKAGLEIVEFWDPVDEGGDGIVEAVRV
ncbi:S-adenosyl-L-methionine-dependent methyltransferase [Aspergillus recurvatus]